MGQKLDLQACFLPFPGKLHGKFSQCKSSAISSSRNSDPEIPLCQPKPYIILILEMIRKTRHLDRRTWAASVAASFRESTTEVPPTQGVGRVCVYFVVYFCNRYSGLGIAAHVTPRVLSNYPSPLSFLSPTALPDRHERGPDRAEDSLCCQVAPMSEKG